LTNADMGAAIVYAHDHDDWTPNNWFQTRRRKHSRKRKGKLNDTSSQVKKKQKKETTA